MANTSSSKPQPPEWVSEDIIRQHFNQGQYYEKASAGELTMYLKRDSHRDPPPRGEPICTKSQIVYYYDSEGNAVAVVHQYLRPDGTLGGSGLPDPKKLILGDRVIAVRTRKQRDESSQ